MAACSSGVDLDVAPKNLLMVIFDTTRADHFSTYGYEKPTTPTVDALAKRGAQFDFAYSQSSLTPVSAGAFFTGTLPNRHGIRSLMSVGKESLSEGAETLAQRLSANGIRTAGFVSARPMGAHYGLGRGFETFSDDVGTNVQKAPCGNEYQRRADVTTDLALDWLGSNGLNPFMLMVHFFDAHDANLAPPREFLEERVSFALPANIDEPCALRGMPKKFRKELYDAELAWMDAQLARLLERLERLGVLDETLVTVLADHGEGLGQHDNWTHGWLHREQLRVPLVMAGPGIERGAVIETPVRLIDLFPTYVDLFGVRGERENIQGISLVPLLRGATEAPRDLYAEVHHDTDDFLGRDPAMFSLEAQDWKLIHRPESGKHELYDLAEDPGELVNVYEADHPEAIQLLRKLEGLGVLGGELITSDELSEEDRDALGALGYIGTAEDEETDDGASNEDKPSEE